MSAALGIVMGAGCCVTAAFGAQPTPTPAVPMKMQPSLTTQDVLSVVMLNQLQEITKQLASQHNDQLRTFNRSLIANGEATQQLLIVLNKINDNLVKIQSELKKNKTQ